MQQTPQRISRHIVEIGTMNKPLGRKAYGHIPHLPGSRMGPGDHKCHEGQARIATEKARDKHDVIYVQEKLDGSCVAVAKINNELVPLGRAGYLAQTSPYEQHHLFADWVRLPKNYRRFDAMLKNGERAVGEWLAQAHGTRYDLTFREPFVLFDIMVGTERMPLLEMESVNAGSFELPSRIGYGPTSIEAAMQTLGRFGNYGAQDQVEGAVWRVERKGKVDFLVKYVRPEKVDGLYLPEKTGKPAVWNWRP